GIIIGILVGVTISLARYGLTVLGETNGLDSDTAYILARSLIIGVSFGLAIGWRHGLVVGLVGGVVSGLLYHFAFTRQGHTIEEIWGLVGGIVFGMSLTGTFVMPFVLANHLAGAWAGAWAGALGSYGRHIIFDAVIRKNVPVWPVMPVGFLGVILGLTQVWWRPLFCYPLVTAWNLLLYRADERRLGQQRRSLLRWHSAFWDEDQFLQLPGLDDHLLLVMEYNPVEGQAAIDYLATGRQRWAIQAVQIELDARQLAQCAGVMAIRKIHRSLAPSELTDTKITTLLRNFSRISRDVDAALNQKSAYNQRHALSRVEERLDGLLRDLNRSSESYVIRFRPIILRWRQIVADRVQELTEVTKTLQEINSPYVIGMPLMEQQEVFVGRNDISDNIEQFLLDRLCPPLLLYGQRRMGKTSLLNNLGRLLPSTILPLFVDLQGPTSWSTDHAGFLYGIAQGMIASAERQRGSVLPPLARETLTVDPFICFDQWLNKVEQTLASYEFKRVL
ncbi:MAG: ATP-binding protein, partial [Gammaproteobacteria bacterium]|nr:ATP-binding protein [Gammaproteobacteria bacterium]NIW99426.1 ATP-binding protein [Phycisphaerae bacterium]